MNNETQPKQIAVFRFYTWSKTHGRTTSVAMVTIDGLDLVKITDPYTSMRIMGEFKITKAEMRELNHTLTLKRLGRESKA